MSIKQIQRESKKQNYMDGFKQAQQMILDESNNNFEESINLDNNDSGEEEEEVIGDVLGRVQHYPTPNMKAKKVVTKRIDLANGGDSSKGEKDKDNPFQMKKKGFVSSLSKAFKGIF